MPSRAIRRIVSTSSAVRSRSASRLPGPRSSSASALRTSSWIRRRGCVKTEFPVTRRNGNAVVRFRQGFDECFRDVNAARPARRRQKRLIEVKQVGHRGRNGGRSTGFGRGQRRRAEVVHVSRPVDLAADIDREVPGTETGDRLPRAAQGDVDLDNRRSARSTMPVSRGCCGSEDSGVAVPCAAASRAGPSRRQASGRRRSRGMAEPYGTRSSVLTNRRSSPGCVVWFSTTI